MIWKKVTHGWVTQVYENGVCIEQSFFAGDLVEYENDQYEDNIDPPKNYQYQEFDMIQPHPPQDTTL